MKNPNLVFVVDDSEIFLSLFSNRLSKKGGYEVKGFSDGTKMLRDLYLKPAAILIDYFLDSSNKLALNGKEILEIIKLMRQETPVIVFSGLCNPEKINELKGMGIKNFFSKQEHNFLEKVEEALKNVIG